ncbi:dihydroxy-acid dehydratase [Paraburkholderia sediminicola]|uniref:dihydroxy-acid dehydratase n=1 Tax=Paraburkholderia sediminicola TaxID=458836 RepID=UPI0038BA74DF
MNTTYRSNFAPGTTRWAIRRAQWRALGISDADMEKPKIAVINTSSELSICFSHLDEVARIVKQAIRDAGGLPFEIGTTAPSDFITGAGRSGRYLMPSRDLIVNDIEASVEGAMLDGMVCLSSCDKTAPAHLMAAARLNIPTVLVIGGYQGCGRINGEKVDIEDVFESAGELAMGHKTISQVEQMCEVAIQGPGVCAGMGTANTMHIMAESIGMTLPGSAPVPAGSPKMLDLAAQAGRRIVAMVEENLRPRDIMTPAAFRNAITVGLAVSGSINMLRHLQGVAAEGEVNVNVYQLVRELDGAVPLLCAIKPNGPGRIEDLDTAGGSAAVMTQLGELLDTSVLTVTGKSLADNLVPHRVLRPDVIGSIKEPAARGPSIVILIGSLAPKGSIMKLGLGDKADRFSGPCRVFESQEAALDALDAGHIQGGEVVVLRRLGARGGPGVASASWFVAAVNGAQLGSEIAVITDGQLSGLNRGFTIGQVMPEAADGGPIAYVQEGDIVTIDVTRRSVDLDVSAEELAKRKASAVPPRTPAPRGWLRIYQHLVHPLSEGGSLVPRD